MTWQEFKELVDKKIEEEGSEQSVQIGYIDISYPRKKIVDIWLTDGELCVG